jgi:hypothetical protein
MPEKIGQKKKSGNPKRDAITSILSNPLDVIRGSSSPKPKKKKKKVKRTGVEKAIRSLLGIDD